MVDWLKDLREPSGLDAETYSLDKAKKQFEVKELVRDAWLVIHRKDESWMEFALLQFVCSEAGGTNILAECVFHGCGPSGGLRECRHTWWGDGDRNGYIFYPQGKAIAAAFKALSEYYDDMV